MLPSLLPPPLPTDSALILTLSLSESRDLFLWASFPPFISSIIYVPRLLSPAWLARKAIMSLGIWPHQSLALGSQAPSPSSSFIFWVSVRPSGSCPGAWRALLVLSSERTIVRGPWDCEVRRATGSLSGAQELGDLSRIISIAVGCSGLAVGTSKS